MGEDYPQNRNLAREIAFENRDGLLARLEAVNSSMVSNEDAVRVTEICNQPSVKKWVTGKYASGLSGEYTLDDAKKMIDISTKNWVEGKSFVYFVRSSDDEIVGCIDIQSNNLKSSEIGYWADERAGGYMTNAVSELCGLAREAGYVELFAYVDPKNDPSLSLLERLSFENEGLVSVEQEQNQLYRITKQLRE